MILIKKPRRGCAKNKQNVKYDKRMIRLQINVRETEWDTEKGQSRETGNIWYTRRRKTQQTDSTIFDGHH